MTPELTVLALAALLQGVQFCIYSVLANIQVTPRYALSPRDEPRQLTGIAGRSQRALNNHFESLALFTPAVLVITLSGNESSFTASCAGLYLGARLLYVPAYLFGWSPWRTVIWFAGFLATMALLLAALV